MTKPILANAGEIENALIKVKSVVSEILTNMDQLRGLQNTMNEQNDGTANVSYNKVADALGAKIDAYQQSITALDRATDSAAGAIKQADARVASMFENLI